MFSLVRAVVVSGQQLGKYIPAATDMNATIEERCFLGGLYREVITRAAGAMSSIEFCTGGCEDGN
jgi:hypothetical protein